MSTNHCARTYFWWVRACAPHLWFVHLPSWHFSLHLPPLQRPGMCAVYNFERLRFCSLPTSSQESVKHKSTFTSTFTLRTIYEVKDTATWVLGVVLFNRVSSHLPPSPPHRLHPSLSLFVRGSLNSFSSHFSFIWSIHASVDQSIDPSIHPSIIQSIYPLGLLLSLRLCTSSLVGAPTQLTLFTSPNTPSTPRHVCSLQFWTLEILQSPDKFTRKRKTQINVYV